MTEDLRYRQAVRKVDGVAERDILYEKYGMGIGMEDKTVKKKVWGPKG